MKPSEKVIAHQVAVSLAEDIGTGDVSAQLIESDAQAQATIYCREHAVVCGIDWFNQAFLQLDDRCAIDWSVQDGDALESNQAICLLSGSARALLSAERTALNFLQTLSGVASKAAQLAALITVRKDRDGQGTQKEAAAQTRILDTRKTIPGLRLAQKYAVSVGGCDNHRIGLYDAFLIKENHIASSTSIADALQKARTINPTLLVEIEVETLEQLQQAIAAGADRIMLDNFSLEGVVQAMQLTQGRVELEVSGNLDEAQLPDLIATGIDYISIGALTKHVKAVDFSMRFQEHDSSLIADCNA